MKEAKFFKVRSFTDKGKTYTIRQTTDEGWKCDCPAFVFNGKCDHVKKFRHQKMEKHGRKK